MRALLESRAIVDRRIDVVHFSGVIIIGMAFIFVSVWFFFSRGLMCLVLLSLNLSPLLV